MSESIKDLRLSSLPLSVISTKSPENITRIRKWNMESKEVADSLHNVLAQQGLESSNLGLQTEAIAASLAIAVPLCIDEYWTEASLQTVGKNIISRLPPPTLEVITYILLHHIKPWFARNPHSRINASTGRKRPRPAGGPTGAMDFYDDQEWKNYPWVGQLLLWCASHMEADHYERVWPLVIPPSMTLLDDYDSYCKLQGIRIISEMLKHMPTELLRRTGVDGLLASSLNVAMLHLHSPLTPDIIAICIPTYVRLIQMTTSKGSKDRFNQISSLLADGVIGGVWTYAYNEYDALKASVLALPVVIRELGIGTARYLKPLISQLCHNISFMSLQNEILSLSIASLEILVLMIEICQARISTWSKLITDALAKAWVLLAESSPSGKQGQFTSSLSNLMVSNLISEAKTALKRASSALATAYPPVIQNEYTGLLLCDKEVFQDLLPSSYAL